MTSFTLIMASAGSGKTHRITLEFLKMILPNPTEAGRILSITFTNKAAGEMKERVISSLAELSHNPGTSKMLDSLLKAFPGATSEDIQQQANRALVYVLHHYSDIAISTIDSFMQRIIRTFSRELQLPAHYEVTVGDEELNEMIITSVIDKANLDEGVTKVLKDIIRLQMDDENAPLNLTGNLAPLVSHLTAEASMQIVDHALQSGTQKMIDSFQLLQKKNKDTATQIRSRLEEFFLLLQQHAIQPDDFRKKGNSKNLYECMLLLRQSLDAKTPSDTMLTLLHNGEILSVSQPGIESQLQKIIIEVLDLVTDYRYGKLMTKRFPVVALLSEIWSLREAYKTENNIVPVSDFNRIIREVLSKEPVPFIYMRAGSRYKTIMIDEFQDTSLMQWLNLLPLIHESLSRGHSSWVVGDPKQSIYRWRNGKVEIMLSLPELFEANEDNADAQTLIENYFHKEPITFNFRSGKNIVLFNSELYKDVRNRFNQALQPAEQGDDPLQNTALYTKVYEEIEQQPAKKTGGYVECRFYNSPLKDIRSKWLSDIVQLIEELKASGYRYSDIAIIDRSNRIGVEVSTYLMGQEKPIPVISRETLQFNASGHCRLAMSVFRLLHFPADDLNAAEAFMLMQQYTDIDLGASPELQNFAREKNNKRGNILRNLLVEYAPALDPATLMFLAPVDQLDIIIHSLNIAASGGFFLLFLREQLLMAQDKTGFNHDALWQWWSEKGYKTSVVVPDSGDAVNVLTVHKSKGLQFPVVIMPLFDINEGSKLHKTMHWHNVDEEKFGIPYTIINYKAEMPTTSLQTDYQVEKSKSLMDTINLMYVGTTRAEERLYTISFKKKEKAESKSKKPSKKEADNKFEGNSTFLLHEFIKKNTIGFIEEENEFFTAYCLGDKSEKPINKEESLEKWTLDTFFINPDKPLDSLRKNAGAFDSSELRDSAREGRIVHELLSKINAGEDVEPVVDLYTSNGWIDHEKRDSLIQFFNQLIQQHPYIFPGKNSVMNEREISNAEGHIYRPDRMTCDDQNNWRIIDFKTGNEKEAHKKQVMQYADLLSEAGMNVQSSHILYIDTEKYQAYTVNL